jgi:uncharacterized glyoxalase superfamily metalloenzyme YdcJ
MRPTRALTLAVYCRVIRAQRLLATALTGPRCDLCPRLVRQTSLSKRRVEYAVRYQREDQREEGAVELALGAGA